MGIIDTLIVILYLALMIGVGFFARKSIKSIDDFLIAGSSFETFYLVGTTMASLVGAGLLLSVVSAAYRYGSGFIWNYVGFALGLLLFALVFAKPIWDSKKKSMAEILASNFGRLPRFVAGILAAFYSFFILAIGVTGMSRIIVYIFGDALSSNTATIIAMIVGIGLTALGGLYSVVWTDTMQFLLMIAVVTVITPIVVLCNVSLHEIDIHLSEVGGSLSNPVQNVPFSYIFMCVATMCLSTPGDPMSPQRAMAGKDSRTVQKAFLICAVLALVFGIALVIIGGGAMVLLPDIVQTHGTTEAAFPVLILQYFPPVLKGLGISALIAAVISTVTSTLLVGTTHLVYDAGQSLFPNIPEKKFKAVMPIAIVLYGAVATWMSLSIASIASVLYMAFSLCGAAFVIPMFLVLYWKKTSKWGITLGMLSGAFYVIAVQFFGLPAPGGDSVYMGLLLSLIVTVVGSLLIPNKDSVHAN